MGIKYIVIISPEIKKRIARENNINVVHDTKGGWTIFQLQYESMPKVRSLQYKPALIVSGFSVKLRRRNEYDFIRFAEEQFNDGWFDVLLARSAEPKIDRIKQMQEFGALIIETYNYDDEDMAYNQLLEFAKRHPLILFSSNDPLYRRLEAGISEFPLAVTIERANDQNLEWVDSKAPSFHYDSSSIRKEWQRIRQLLDQNKIPVNVAADIVGKIEQTDIQVQVATSTSGEPVPIVINTTYHPNWFRKDAKEIYAATPFSMLTFVSESTNITYTRRPFDRGALLISACTLIALCFFTRWTRIAHLAQILKLRRLKKQVT